MVQLHKPLMSLSDPYYLHIGAVIHRWATLEYQLQTIIWQALGLSNKEGRVLTVGMNGPTLSGILRTITRKWVTHPALVKEINSLADDIKKATPFRNYLAHGVWTADPKDEKLTPHLNYMKEAKDRILPGSEQVEPEHIHQFAQLVGTLNQRAELLLRGIRKLQRASQNKSEQHDCVNCSIPPHTEQGPDSQPRPSQA